MSRTLHDTVRAVTPSAPRADRGESRGDFGPCGTPVSGLATEAPDRPSVHWPSGRGPLAPVRRDGLSHHRRSDPCGAGDRRRFWIADCFPGADRATSGPSLEIQGDPGRARHRCVRSGRHGRCWRRGGSGSPPRWGCCRRQRSCWPQRMVRRPSGRSKREWGRVAGGFSSSARTVSTATCPVSSAGRGDMRLVGRATLEQVRALGTGAFAGIIHAAHPTTLVISAEGIRDDALVAVASDLHVRGLRVRTLSDFYERNFSKVPVSDLSKAWFLFDVAEIHSARIYGPLRDASRV